MFTTRTRTKPIYASGSQTFNANGTFTVPAGITRVTVQGGGGTGNGTKGSGAGGSGIVIIRYAV